MSASPIIVAVLAHNEERRIAACLESLPLGEPGVEVHVVVNGSSDATAAIARGFAGVAVHEYAQGGKARSWNRFVLDTDGAGAGEAEMFVFVDGDAQVLPGAIPALAEALETHPQANAASGFPRNGRGASAYRGYIIEEHGLFGDLYALRGSFVARMRASGLRLPEDVIGDDSLIGALAKTDLGHEDEWDDARVVPCPAAGFLCEPTRMTLPSLRGQSKRMVNYSLRHFQNRMISEIMRGPGPGGLPERLAAHYPFWLPRLRPRLHPCWWWFDRAALARMRAAVL